MAFTHACEGLKPRHSKTCYKREREEGKSGVLHTATKVAVIIVKSRNLCIKSCNDILPLQDGAGDVTRIQETLLCPLIL